MDVIEFAVGFATFVGVAIVMTLLLEMWLPGSSANPFIGAAVGFAAGWMVTQLFGE